MQSFISKIKESFRGEVRLDEPMSAHTSLKIGGTADLMAFPEDPMSLQNLLVLAGKEKVPVFVLGGGTNLLVSDSGLRGIAVSLKAFRNIRLAKGSDDKSATLFVEAGVPLGKLMSFAKENGYSGIEPLAGIPGSFGGAVYMNAGSFGAEIKDVLISVAVMNMEGKIMILGKDKLQFTYRSSNISNDLIILSANILLKKDAPGAVAARIKEFIGKKSAAQPLGEASAGCVFRNPEGDAAGRLIDAAGCKGMRRGDAEVSAVHANFFVNKGKAT
ncbi:MAG: UDP-N-acetylmuramate dehydrogenase, partial [Nitrospirota bacterium]